MTRPLRVLHISPRYRGGGAERAARELFEHQRARGLETRMLVATLQGDEPEGVQRVRLPGERWLRPLNWLPTINDWRHFGSRRLARTIPGVADVVHLHNLHGDWLSIRGIAKLAERVPCVWTLHDEWAPNLGMPYDLLRHLPLAEARALTRGSVEPKRFPMCPSPWSQRWRRFLEQALPQPRVAICASSYMKRLAEDSGLFRGRVVERIYGLTLLDEPGATMSRAEARRRWSLPDDPAVPVVLMVCMDFRASYKGVPYGVEALQQAAARLRARGLPRLCVLGLGRAASEVAAALGDAAMVREGYVSDAASLAAAYRAADVTLIPSIAEALSFVALESLACRTPIACFRIGGPGQIAGEGERGLSVPPYDIAGLAVAVEHLACDAEQRADLGEAGRRWVEERCEMNRYVDDILALYEEAMHGPAAFVVERGRVP